MTARKAAGVRVCTPGKVFALFRALSLILATIFTLSVSQPAWSFETAPMSESHALSGAVAPVVLRPDASSGDPCLYMLKTMQAQESTMANERRYRETSGSAMAVGLVLGVRFALGPQERTRSGQRPRPVAAFHVWEPHQAQSPALAIADYRACRNQHTLQALTD